MTFNKDELYLAKVYGSTTNIEEIAISSNSDFIGKCVYSVNHKRPIGMRWNIPISDIDTYFTAKLISKEDNPEYFL